MKYVIAAFAFVFSSVLLADEVIFVASDTGGTMNNPRSQSKNGFVA